MASSSAQLYGCKQTADNFNWSTVTRIDSTALEDVDGIRNPDYLLSFSVSFAALAAAMGLDTVTFPSLTFVAAFACEHFLSVWLSNFGQIDAMSLA